MPNSQEGRRTLANAQRYGHPRSRHGNSIVDLRSSRPSCRIGGNKSSSGGTQGRKEVQVTLNPPINGKPLPSNTGGRRQLGQVREKKGGGGGGREEEEEEDANECRLEFHITSLPLASTLRHLYSVNTRTHTGGDLRQKRLVVPTAPVRGAGNKLEARSDGAIRLVGTTPRSLPAHPARLRHRFRPALLNTDSNEVRGREAVRIGTLGGGQLQSSWLNSASPQCTIWFQQPFALRLFGELIPWWMTNKS